MARNVTARAVHFRCGLNFFTLSNKPFIHSDRGSARLVRGADFVLGHRTPSAPVLYWDKDKSRVSSQGYAVVVVLVSKVNQLQVRRLEAE